MGIKTVGIVSPGDMGGTVGRVLIEHGLRVIACLEDRSERTRNLATQAGIEAVDSFHTLVEQADIILSILVPAQAKEAAQQIASIVAKSHADTIYVDCNAIAPQTTREINQIITEAGGTFIDASIIGPPPHKPGDTRFYTSGPRAEIFAELNEFGLDVRVLGAEIGQASAIKMCYAALTKGLTALASELLIASEALNVSQPLAAEFEMSQPQLYQRLARQVPRVPAKSRRFVGEMEEIAATFESVGLTPNILTGAADMYRFIGSTPFADRAPEDESSIPKLEDFL
ncbi:MAG: DUF1932 domain-containing protein, partial [Chloroflexota bacterium]